MSTMTLAIPNELKEKMKRFPEINWSEVARQAIAQKMRAFEEMNRLLAHSRVSESDAVTYGHTIKRRVNRKHKPKA